jgi:hypothetical protein
MTMVKLIVMMPKMTAKTTIDRFYSSKSQSVATDVSLYVIGVLVVGMQRSWWKTEV